MKTDFQLQSLTVSAHWLNNFATHLESQDRSQNTIKAYCKDIELYATWFEGQNGKAFQPSMLCAPDLREYRRHLFDDQQLDGDSWNRKRASFRAFAYYCNTRGWVHGDPLIGVNRVPPKEQPPKALTPEEYRAIRRQMDIQVNTARTDAWRWQATRDRAILSLMLYCGLRSSEVVKLDVSDLLLRERSGEIRVRQGKGRKDAHLPVGLEARTALKDWITLHPGTVSLFPSRRSDRISQRQIETAVKAIGKSAGLNDMWPHRARHTLATRALNELEMPLPVVQGLMRHKDGRTTLRYAKPTDAQLADAAERL